MVWQIKERKAPGRRYHDCGGPGAVLSSFCQVSPQKNDPKNLRWSVGIQPPLKARLNILSLARSWTLWCCLCRTHVIFNRVEPPLKRAFPIKMNFWNLKNISSLFNKRVSSFFRKLLKITFFFNESTFDRLRRKYRVVSVFQYRSNCPRMQP